MHLTNQLYEQLLNTYNNDNDAFWKLDVVVIGAFFDRMYCRCGEC